MRAGAGFDPSKVALGGIRLIEASAGTGKTFNLAALYLRLVVEQRAAVREILVMTFTRAATRELRERIRRRLLAAARIAARPDAAGPTPEDAFARDLIKASDESKDQLARRLTVAAHRIDEAAIFTIHGFCQRALAENAFDSNTAFDRGEQVDDNEVHAEAAADYWRARVFTADPAPGFLDTWPASDNLAGALRPLRARPLTRLAGPGNEVIAGELAELRHEWRQTGAKFAEQINQLCASDALKKSNLSSAIEACGGMEGALDILTKALERDTPIPLLPAWTRYLQNPEDQFNNKKKALLARGQALFEWPLAQTLARLQPFTHIAALRHAREHIHAAAAERKRRRRQFSFADMIGALHDALVEDAGGARLADALHGAWPWALVDEFQDTDPQQYAILRAIYSGRDSGGLLLIGDPKQAIYGFRGGDVHAYLQAAKDAGGNVDSLASNYRSTPGLLAAVETLYRTPADAPFLVEGINYPHVKAADGQARALHLDGRELAPMTIWHQALGYPNKPPAEQACQQACVIQIQALLDARRGQVERTDPASGEVSARGLQAADIAVLVNTNAQAAAMQRALSRAGLAAVCLHPGSVFQTEEAVDIVHVLTAAANPTHEGRLRAALAGRLHGYRLAELVELERQSEQWQAVIERCQDGQQRWQENGVLSLLQPLIQDAAPRLLAWEDGERRVSNYLQLAELLAAAEAATFGMTGLVQWLRRAVQDDSRRETAEEEQLRLESDDALVRITTIHKAKGLEYPVVFLPFAPWTGAQGAPDKPPHDYHGADGCAEIDPTGAAGCRGQAIREARAAGLRLLYVALTRAEIACFLPWLAANGTPNSALASLLHRDTVGAEHWAGPGSKKPLTNEITGQRLQEVAARAGGTIAVAPWPARAESARRRPAPAPPGGQARTDLPAPRRPWSIFSFTRLAHAAGPAPAGAGAEDEAHSERAAEAEAADFRLPELPGGSAFGTAVHTLLESITEPAAWPPPDAERQVASTLRRYGIVLPAQGKRSVEIIDATVALISRTLQTPLPEIGPLAGIAAENRLAEMEFMLRLRGQRMERLVQLLNAAGYGEDLPASRQNAVLGGLMHGFIDLVVEHGGRYYVIDYKTNWLGADPRAYREDGLKQAMAAHHYDLQYLIYTTALHRHLRQRLPGYHPERHLGGALYLFLRGMAPDADTRGIFHHRPDPRFIERLADLLDESP